MIEWTVSDGYTDYPTALAAMEARVRAIRQGQASEWVWLVEHPPLLTAGTSAQPGDLRDPGRFPIHQVRRGGRYTYHGPGQRVVYVMLDLAARGRDVRRFVHGLEEWCIAALGRFQVRGETRADRVGVWVARPDKPALGEGRPAEDKIAALGVRVQRWVSSHGMAINVDPDLAHFDAIVPCGIANYGVTSLVDLGLPVAMADLDMALRETFDQRFALESAARAL